MNFPLNLFTLPTHINLYCENCKITTLHQVNVEDNKIGCVVCDNKCNIDEWYKEYSRKYGSIFAFEWYLRGI